VVAGQVSTVTWRLTFENPTPLTIGELMVRDPLPPGLVYLDGRASRGTVDLSGVLSQTVVVARLGELGPGESAELVIRTAVLSETAAGTVFKNRAGYSALNLDPGRSNEASLVVQGLTLLPVTGGLLDPRTPGGQITWGMAVLLASLVHLAARLGWLQPVWTFIKTIGR
jgi:uncharacterized repeat protein (TIGR01451 family)